MKTLFRLIVFFIVAFWLFTSLIELFQQTSGSAGENYCEDYSELDSLTYAKTHQRNWALADGSGYFCATYQSSHELNGLSEEKRNNIDPNEEDYSRYWGSIYEKLVEENQAHVSYIADSLLRVAQIQELEAERLAELVVAFVQDIPYSFVDTETCTDPAMGGRPCVPGAKFGILSPYEFVHSLAGDCDTRAVLLFALLDYLEFDPLIVISYEYRHAMLALHVPAAGDFISLRGKNYYFWETTATGWQLGMLPPDMRNVDYWEIALANEL